MYTYQHKIFTIEFLRLVWSIVKTTKNFYYFVHNLLTADAKNIAGMVQNRASHVPQQQHMTVSMIDNVR